MKARRLNELGMSCFNDYILKARSGINLNVPTYLLDSDQHSEAIGLGLDIDDRAFASRYEFAEYLESKFSGHDVQRLIGDRGFWTWLALFWFEQLCPVKDGFKRPSKEYNYILSTDFRHRPRHAIYMSWQLVSRYGSRAKFLLSKEPSTRGEITEQMMARQEILSSEGVMNLASELYFDPISGTFKKGAAARTSPGCVSRYVKWLQQLMVTYDIFSTTQKELEELLPKEFDRFRELT